MKVLWKWKVRSLGAIERLTACICSLLFIRYFKTNSSRTLKPPPPHFCLFIPYKRCSLLISCYCVWGKKRKHKLILYIFLIDYWSNVFKVWTHRTEPGYPIYHSSNLHSILISEKKFYFTCYFSTFQSVCKVHVEPSR